MAQTGYTPISLYYSSTASATPTAGNLVAGELAINTADGKLFYKDSAGVVQVIGTKGGVGSSSTTQVLYNSSGLVVGSANMTFNGTTLTLANDASISGLTVGKGGGAVSSNTAVGANALGLNSTGAENTALGVNSLLSNTTTGNTGIGFYAASATTTGQYNVAVGRYALTTNTTGGNNTALGMQALQANTTASNNTAVGYQAGYSNTTGSYNVFLGHSAGYTSNVNGNAFNTALGYWAGYSLTTGVNNTFVGQNSGVQISTGSKNSIFGAYNGNQGGLDIRTSSNYIVLSDGDGNPKAFIDERADSRMFLRGTGANNSGVVVGQGSTGTEYGYVTLGVSYGVASSKDVALGLSNTVGARIYVQNRSAGVYLTDGGTSWTSNSDERLKENLVPITDAANKVASLRAVTGNYIADENKKSRAFLIAQDVQAVLPEAVDTAKDEIGTLGVAYTDLIPLLVAAIQELNAKLETQALEIATLKDAK